MDLGARLRRELVRPSIAVAREELVVLAASAVVIIVAAQLNEPGTRFDLALIVVGGIALTALGLVRSSAVEATALAVILSVCVAVGHQGHLELALFLVVTTTLYVAWHIGSTARAAAVAVVSCIAIWLGATVRVRGYNWTPWVAAELFTFVLGTNVGVG